MYIFKTLPVCSSYFPYCSSCWSLETSLQQYLYLTRHFWTTLMTLWVLMQGKWSKSMLYYKLCWYLFQYWKIAETAGRDFQNKSSLMWERVGKLQLHVPWTDDTIMPACPCASMVSLNYYHNSMLWQKNHFSNCIQTWLVKSNNLWN